MCDPHVFQVMNSTTRVNSVVKCAAVDRFYLQTHPDGKPTNEIYLGKNSETRQHFSTN